MEKVIPIHNEPTADELWRGIGGHFDSLTQIINEMIDDSISAFVAEETAGEIIVSLTELPNNDVKITIEDSGCGMAKLDDVFRLGSQAASMSPLNEHGFGLKHALASVDVSNTSWAVYTRTKEDFSKGVYKKISAPYKTKDFTALVCDDAWPGKLTGTGTVVQFICPRVMYNTLGKGIREVMTNNFISLADILCEDIGFFYSRLLKTEKVKISLNITDIDGDKSLVLVAPLLPLWNSVKTGEANCDLGYGPVKIEYEYGRIGKKPARKQFDNATSYKYYTR